jgi:hypothetical protein
MDLQDSAFALQDSGPISLGDIRTELGNTGIISLNDADVRALAGRPSGVISMSNFYGAVLEIAIGGVIRDYGIYRSHTFTSSGTFTVLNPLSMDILLVAAGGNGGIGAAAGGGGAGGMNVYTQTISAGTYSATVGQPHATGIPFGNGGNTIFNGRTMIGGGDGGKGAGSQGSQAPGQEQGISGGSSGGAGPGGTTNTGVPVAGQGHKGGAAIGQGGGGGGGGAGGNGHDGLVGNINPDENKGGDGLNNSYSTGSNIEYAHGGASSPMPPPNSFNGAAVVEPPYTTPGSGGNLESPPTQNIANPIAPAMAGIVVIRYIRP